MKDSNANEETSEKVMLNWLKTKETVMLNWLKTKEYNNLSPVTGSDGVFRSRGGLFTQYRGSAETVTREPEISIRTGFFFLHIILKNKNRSKRV